MYYENVDYCGSYYKQDLGAPPSANYFYSIKYNGAGRKRYNCPNTVPFYGYTFEYRKGSSSTPFFYGVLSTGSGLAMAKTEVQGNPPLSLVYYGCSNLSCNDTPYAIMLFLSAWSLWTASSTSSNGNPPYLRTFNSYWSFKTCPTSC